VSGLRRLLSASGQEPPDTRPSVLWPGGSRVSDDAAVLLPGDSVSEHRTKAPERAILRQVFSPFGIALAEGENLAEAFRESPGAGEPRLEARFERARAEIAAALEAGADGILYALFGASPDRCTPMEYGGHFLERDRQLLQDAADARFVLLFVVGSEGTYLDLASDLPAHAFGWDVEASGFPVAEMRKWRPGALCAARPETEIELVSGTAGRPIGEFLIPEVSRARK